MKKVSMLFAVIALLVISCAKMPQSDAVVNPPITAATFVMKAGTTTSANDTLYAPAGIVTKFWLDNLPLAVNLYTFTWNLAGGTTSAAAEPEKAFTAGLYQISVTCTPVAGGTSVVRSKYLRVAPDIKSETTIILISSALVGNLWNYTMGMRASAIADFSTITTSPWVYGSFIDPNAWVFENSTETKVINEITYIVYHVFTNNGIEVKNEWLYGRGEASAKRFSFAPTSSYWFSLSATEGKFVGYFKNGAISPKPNVTTTKAAPGDNGDDLNGLKPPTIRTSVIYNSGTTPDSLKVFVNCDEYAKGTTPFLKKMVSDNNWQTIGLTQMTGTNVGWGYKSFAITDIPNGKLLWKIGPNSTKDTEYGNMSVSKFYMSGEGWLGLQILDLKNGSYQIVTIK